MKTCEPYGDTECPRCGNTGSNRDHGPYEYIPGLDDAIGGAPDPCVHLMQCGGCGKPFGAAPAEFAETEMAWVRVEFPDACPSLGCHPGDHTASIPLRLYEKRGRYLGEYQCPRGHRWVTHWRHTGVPRTPWWPIERDLVTGFPSERDDSGEVASLEAALAARPAVA